MTKATVLLHPHLARNAVVQSGSFHFDPSNLTLGLGKDRPSDEQLRAILANVGVLRTSIRAGSVDVTARLAVTIGREEPIYLQTQGFLEDCATQGVTPVFYREDYGGHNYALWRQQMYPALAALSS